LGGAIGGVGLVSLLHFVQAAATTPIEIVAPRNRIHVRRIWLFVLYLKSSESVSNFNSNPGNPPDGDGTVQAP